MCLCALSGIKDANTFTRWRNFYMSNGCFEPDRRGRFAAGFLLRHDDIKSALTQWLLARVKRDINISDVRTCMHVTRMSLAFNYIITPHFHHAPQTRDYINDILLSSFPIGKIDSKSGLCRPISYETTHQWMLMCGCKYKTFQKSYYNDTHERHDNQLDRVTKASRHLFVSLREEKWYCISTAEKKKMQQKYSDWYSPRTHPHTHTRACAHITHAYTHTYPLTHALITTTRPQDSVAKRIPFDDVGQFPPNGGTPYYIEQKQDVDSLDDWFEYHTDFLPEDLVLTLNSGLGGYVSQRRSIKMPLAAPKTNDECIDRLCDLLTTSCPETHLLLQRNIDRAVIGTFIR